MNNNTQKTRSRKRRAIAGRLSSSYMRALSTTSGYNSFGYPLFR